MPDGAQQPEDPAAAEARRKMQEWKEKQHEGDGGGWWTTIGNSIGDMFAAAEAGAFAVSPDTGAAIIKQLTSVQDQVAEMQATVFMGGQRQRLGGGYATDIATFNTQVTDEGPAKLLKTFAQELEQLKAAVQKSIEKYGTSDTGNRQNINRSGGGLGQ